MRMGPVAHVVQTALECTRASPVTSVCLAAKLKPLHGVRDTQRFQRSERILIYRPVHRKCDRFQKGKSWFILILISIL